MSENAKMDRRKFIGASAAGVGLVTAGGVVGWVAMRRDLKHPLGTRQSLDDRFNYDVSAFAHTDPALLLYDETAPIASGFNAPKCIASGPADQIIVGGDQGVRIFGKDGHLKSAFTLPDKPHAIHPSKDGTLLVAMKNHTVVLDQNGKTVTVGASLGEKVYITAVTRDGDSIFVADAGNREVIRCDSTGKTIARFGRIGTNDGSPGFVVPSPYFDLLMGDDGLLWVANPGRHRVEGYTTDGHLEVSWGKTSMAVEGFCGCCNPVYFTRLPDGRFVTSEKGLNRIKIHDEKGKFAGVVAGPEQLVKDLDLARQACANCEIGFGFDVACDSGNRVFALDPATREVRIFVPKTIKHPPA